MKIIRRKIKINFFVNGKEAEEAREKCIRCLRLTSGSFSGL
jgi:hypothetical protein